MVNLLCLLTLSLNISNVDDVTRYVHKNISVDQLLLNHFSDFVVDYNNNNENKLRATSINNYRLIDITKSNDGYFFDLNFGYIVISKNYEILDSSNFDLPFEQDILTYEGEVIFKENIFYKDNGEEFGANDEYDFNPYFLDELNTNTRSNVSDGKIDYYQINSYINEHYNGYNRVAENYIPSYDYIRQRDTSIYIKNENKSIFFEGNCVLNSTYSMLRNMGKNNILKKFYYNDYIIDYSNAVYNDQHYYLTGQGWVINNYVSSLYGDRIIKQIPSVYLNIRNRAINKGYNENSGMTGSKTKDIAYDISREFGYTSLFKNTNSFDDISYLIDRKIPSVVRTSKSTIYGNHQMAVNGYIKLEKKTGWGWFTKVDTKWVLSVDDGHQNSKTSASASYRHFYDPNMSGGANFTAIEYKTIDFSIC